MNIRAGSTSKRLPQYDGEITQDSHPNQVAQAIGQDIEENLFASDFYDEFFEVTISVTVKRKEGEQP